MKILVAEDDEIIRSGIKEYLVEFKYDIYETKDGKEALDVFKKNEIDLVILDIQMPKLTGLEVLEEIRKISDIPVIILTAFNDEKYKIDAFSNLADGYIEKPFSLPVLKARIESLLTKYYNVRRNTNNRNDEDEAKAKTEDKEYNGKRRDIFIHNNAEVNFKSYSAKYNGESIDINAKEIEILKYLLENNGQVLTRGQILSGVWKETEEIPYDRVIDVYIKELRKKLGLDDCIITVRNVGYMLEIR